MKALEKTFFLTLLQLLVGKWLVSAAAFFVFEEVPDSFTLIGAAVIVLASFYITRREVILRRTIRAVDEVPDAKV